MTKDDIGVVLTKVYPNLKLVKTDKPVSNNVKPDTCDVGSVIFSLEEYNLDILSYRTGIKRDRLLRLTKLDRSKIQSHELNLIEMAANQTLGTLFKKLYLDKRLL